MSVATPTDEFVFRLNTVSVVITAEFHNPSILNRDFLASQGIVPPDWEVTASIITPPVSVVRYGNGIEWTVDQSRLNVLEKCGSLFRKEYSVHRLVNAYLEKLPHVPYRSLGLNCNVSMAVNDPQHWITERFLKPGAWLQGEPRVLGMTPKFSVDAGDAVCHFAFGSEEVPRGDRGTESALVVDCNVHHPGPLGVNSLRAAIERWPERQELVIAGLDKLLKQAQS